MDIQALTIWLALAILLALYELYNPSAFTTVFSIGAFAASIAALLAASTNNQIVVFGVISIIFILRRQRQIAALDLMKPATEKTSSPVYAKPRPGSIKGIVARVDEEVEPAIGVGKSNVKGKEWYIFTEDQTPLYKGATVRIKRMSGTRLVVELTKDES